MLKKQQNLAMPKGKKHAEIKKKLAKFPARLKKSNGRGRGRPSLAETVNLEQVYCLCLLGLPNSELATFLKISHDTLCTWINEWEDFSETLTRGRQGAGGEVSQTLFRRAMGWTHEEDVIKVLPGRITTRHNSLTVVGTTRSSSIVRVRMMKHYPPEVSAITYFLNNRFKDYWKNKNDEESAPPPVNGPVNVNIITDEETKMKLLRAEEEAKKRKSIGMPDNTTEE